MQRVEGMTPCSQTCAWACVCVCRGLGSGPVCARVRARARMRVYLHVEVRVEVLLLHQLLDLLSALHELADLLGQNSHVQIGIGNLWDLFRLVILLSWKNVKKTLQNDLIILNRFYLFI